MCDINTLRYLYDVNPEILLTALPDIVPPPLWPRCGVPVWESVDWVCKVSRQLLRLRQEHREDHVPPAEGICTFHALSLRPKCYGNNTFCSAFYTVKKITPINYFCVTRCGYTFKINDTYLAQICAVICFNIILPHLHTCSSLLIYK